MKFLYKVGIIVAVVIFCFVLYSRLGFLYLSAGVFCIALLSYRSAPKEDRERGVVVDQDGRFPIYSDVSAAWIGARLDEKEAWQREAQKEPRDQGH
jgi:hypothetical protein